MTQTAARDYSRRRGTSPMGGSRRDDFEGQSAPEPVREPEPFFEPPPVPPAAPFVAEPVQSQPESDSSGLPASTEPDLTGTSTEDETQPEPVSKPRHAAEPQPVAFEHVPLDDRYVEGGNSTHVWDKQNHVWVERTAVQGTSATLHGSVPSPVTQPTVLITDRPTVAPTRLPKTLAPRDPRARRAWNNANKGGLPLPKFPAAEIDALHDEAEKLYAPLRRERLMLERAAIRQCVIDNPYDHTMTILIVSWRGGAGKTQTTAELAAIIRRELVQLAAVVVAMDGNVDFGMLLFRLGIENDPRAKNTLIRTAEGIEELNSMKAMQTALPVSSEGVIAVPLDFKTPATQGLSQAELDALRYSSQLRVHSRICYSGTYVLIDGGTGDNGITRASRDIADLIILPGHLDREGLEQIRELLTDLASNPSTADLVSRVIILIMNYEISQYDELQTLRKQYLGDPTEEQPLKVGAVRVLNWDTAADHRKVADPSRLDLSTYNQYFGLIAAGHKMLSGKAPRRQLPLYIPATLPDSTTDHAALPPLGDVPAVSSFALPSTQE